MCFLSWMFSWFVDDFVNNWEGQKWQHRGCIQPAPCLAKLSAENATRGVWNAIFTTTWIIVPFCMWHYYVQVSRHLSALNIASDAPFEELLCVWRWRWWCWGGAVLVAEGHGWEEGGYFNFQTGQSSPLLQTHTWLSSLQVCSTCFLFYFKT